MHDNSGYTILMFLQQELRAHIVAARNTIRWHRDQLGDDRCWVDDCLLYHRVLGHSDITQLLPKPEFIGKCRIFHERRRMQSPPGPMPSTPPHPDSDLRGVTDEVLSAKLQRLKDAVKRHYEPGDAKTASDDQDLYLTLPEKFHGDLRHPEQLLENCERFYEVKRKDNPLRIHEW